MIMRCNCAHAGQDALHGAGMRVCNEIKTKGGAKEYRCTVCLTKHTGKAAEPAKETK